MSLYSFTLEQIFDSLGHYTTVTLKNKEIILGYLYTIDPVTNNVVLFKDQHINVLLSHSIENLNIDKDDFIDLSILEKSMEYKTLDKEWLEKRRYDLIQFLEKNRIPIQYEQNEPVIHVLGCARVESPYVATSVVCDNALIRKRVRDLILELSR
ncbi:Gemin6 [Cokeromyces recurvatus]|uniref:Gemin6 n=1 Tax=Cokeromyces recurvatus TaxID=90255 RepID=UPI002220AA4E|nr:Gemin6 [Cokeromyces recurvatus]KAI7905191.1 Gemin6 [Cokeromyces recurvatus]